MGIQTAINASIGTGRDIVGRLVGLDRLGGIQAAQKEQNETMGKLLTSRERFHHPETVKEQLDAIVASGDYESEAAKTLGGEFASMQVSNPNFKTLATAFGEKLSDPKVDQTKFRPFADKYFPISYRLSRSSSTTNELMPEGLKPIYEGVNVPKSADGLTEDIPLYRVYEGTIPNSDKRFDDYFNLNVGNIVGGLDEARYKELYQGLSEKRARDLDIYFSGIFKGAESARTFNPLTEYAYSINNNSKKTLHRIGDRYKYGK